MVKKYHWLGNMSKEERNILYDDRMKDIDEWERWMLSFFDEEKLFPDFGEESKSQNIAMQAIVREQVTDMRRQEEMLQKRIERAMKIRDKRLRDCALSAIVGIEFEY